MKKICVTTKSLSIGGAEVLLNTILPRLTRMGFSIHVVYFDCNNPVFEDELNSNGIEVTYLGQLNFKQTIKTAISYWYFLRKGGFDIVFDNSPIPGFLSRIFKRKEKIIYLEHNIQEAYNSITRFLNKYTYYINDKVICCSQDVYLSNGKIGIVLDNAIDIDSLHKKAFGSLESKPLREQLGWPRSAKVMINVANMSHRKNQKMLLESFAKVNREDLYLLIVGARLEAFKTLEETVQKLKLGSRVTLYGPSHDVPYLLSQSDMFALTSLQEGLPISLLEAMSFGLVPFCTNVGGIGTVINDECGFLVDVDDVDSLSVNIKSLVSDAKQYEKMSKASIGRIASNYGIDNYLIKLEKILTEN